MNEIKVSVVIPVCNVEKYLNECMDSVVNQTLKEIQIICVDDGSTDNSLKILKEYEAKDSRIEVITKPNAGYGHTMNMGFAAAKGEYIGIIESDDYAELNMFEKLYTTAKKKNADIVKSNYFDYKSLAKVKNHVNETLYHCTYNKVINPLVNQEILKVHPCIWTCLYRREFVEENKLTFTETPGASYQDTSFNFKSFALAKRVVLLKDALLHYRLDNPGSSVNSVNKIYYVCEEYASSEKFLDENPAIKEKVKYLFQWMKFDTYYWNYNRLSAALQYEFLERMHAEFEKASNEGLLRKEEFHKNEWELLTKLVADKEKFYKYTGKEFFDEPGSLYKKELDDLRGAIGSIKNSVSYKTGRVLTWPLRKVKAILKHEKEEEIMDEFGESQSDERR